MKKKWLCFLCLLGCFLQGYSLEETRFEWNPSKPTLTSYETLKDRWIASLVQECIRSKLEKESIDQNIAYEVLIEEGILPCRFSAQFFAEEKVYLDTLEKVKEGAEVDFEEQFNVLQALWINWVQSEKNSSFKKKSFESSFTYEEFLDYSEVILHNLKLEDLKLAFYPKQEDPTSRISHRRNRVSFREQLSGRSPFPEKKGWEPARDTARGGEPKSEEAKLFFNLPLTDEDKVLIRKIVTTLADKNVLQLLMDKRSMERKGDKIRPVHPMRFIGFVLADPNLRRCMKIVSKATFKWSGFLDGYEKRMKEESKAGNLSCYSAGLADLLEVEKHVIQRYINQADYEGLVKHFL